MSKRPFVLLAGIDREIALAMYVRLDSGGIRAVLDLDDTSKLLCLEKTPDAVIVNVDDEECQHSNQVLAKLGRFPDGNRIAMVACGFRPHLHRYACHMGFAASIRLQFDVGDTVRIVEDVLPTRSSRDVRQDRQHTQKMAPNKRLNFETKR